MHLVSSKLEKLSTNIEKKVFKEEIESGRRAAKKPLFSEKEFQERSSLLSTKNKGFETVENFFISFLMLLGIYICFEEYFETGSPIPNLELFAWAFARADIVAPTHILMTSIHALVVPLVILIKRYNVSPFYYLVPYGVLWFSMYWVALSAIINYSLPPASAIIVACELARMTMKMHAYMREKNLYGIPDNKEFANFIPTYALRHGVTLDDLKKPKIEILSFGTELKRFFYFYLAPTLIYRD